MKPDLLSFAYDEEPSPPDEPEIKPDLSETASSSLLRELAGLHEDTLTKLQRLKELESESIAIRIELQRSLHVRRFIVQELRDRNDL